MSVRDAAVDLSGPAPRVLVTVDAPGVVHQVIEETRAPVRASFDQAPGGVVSDWEVPQGVEVGYVQDGQATPVRVVVPALEDLWLVPCQAPELATSALIDKDGVGEWEHAGEESVLPIPGGLPHVVSWRSRARSSSLTVLALDADAKDAILACLTAPGHHFCSVPPRLWPWRGVSYVSVSGVQATSIRDRHERWRISFGVTEVARPTAPLLRPAGWAAMPERWVDMPTAWAGMPS